ncbi:MAG: NYN domain-containing protein [Ktedonobacterales bacterium]
MPRSKPTRKAKSTPSSTLLLPRTIVYIDAFNLYYGCLKHTPYRWLNIEQMCTLLLPDHQILAIKYYTARIKPPADDPDKAVRQEVYLRALATLPLVTVTFGQYLSHVIKRPLANPPATGSVLVDIINNEEKGSDVNIATHMVLDAAKNAYDVAVLVSNDSDLQEPLRVVRHEFGKPVGILSPLNTTRRASRELIQYATFTKRIRVNVLQASQFPASLTDSRGTIHQPAKWTHR